MLKCFKCNKFILIHTAWTHGENKICGECARELVRVSCGEPDDDLTDILDRPAP